MRGWLDNLLHLAVLEGKKAGIGLALMLGFGVGEAVLLITGLLGFSGRMCEFARSVS